MPMYQHYMPQATRSSCRVMKMCLKVKKPILPLKTLRMSLSRHPSRLRRRPLSRSSNHNPRWSSTSSRKGRLQSTSNNEPKSKTRGRCRSLLPRRHFSRMPCRRHSHWRSTSPFLRCLSKAGCRRSRNPRWPWPLRQAQEPRVS